MYVCAFAGRRDNYQVPLALSEAGLLEEFVTDAYANRVVRRLLSVLPTRGCPKALSRYCADLPDARVSCLWATAAYERLRHKLGFPRSVTYGVTDRCYSLAAGRAAERTGANLFLYNSYAWEAFSRKYSHQPRRVMFQYHPHPALERQLLTQDYERFPLVAASYAEGAGVKLSEKLHRRETECWRYADLIICASSFTKRSLVAAGASPDLCRVIPYGIDAPPSEMDKAPEAFHVLFAGSGIQRKGLHHLLLAWRAAVLPRGSRLTLVCRNIDPGLDRLVAETEEIELRRGVSDQELLRLFRQSTLFVMPSLVEGFGQVYLEAMACGCPVLGTANTGLPDIGNEQDGIFITPTGNIEALAQELKRLAVLLPGNHQMRHAARLCATRNTWSGFRQKLIRAITRGPKD